MNEIKDIDKTLEEIERQELNLLIKKGFKFNLSYTILKRKKGIPGLLGKTEEEEVTETFEILQPTLSVLDRLTDAFMEMNINEDKLTTAGKQTLEEAMRIANENSERAARFVAIAVLGEDFHNKIIDGNGRIRYKEDNKELDRLTTLFFHAIKPSNLATISKAIISVANLGDFINSMRYMSTRTTAPRMERIE